MKATLAMKRYNIFRKHQLGIYTIVTEVNLDPVQFILIQNFFLLLCVSLMTTGLFFFFFFKQTTKFSVFCATQKKKRYYITSNLRTYYHLTYYHLTQDNAVVIARLRHVPLKLGFCSDLISQNHRKSLFFYTEYVKTQKAKVLVQLP